jgi:GntR family galactonate operon transcriptional repressor
VKIEEDSKKDIRKSYDEISIPELGQKVRMYILEAGYKPDDKIETEEEMARKFRTSRYKIRMVFNALVQEGALSRSPRRGTFIKRFNPNTVIPSLGFSYRVSNYNIYELVEARIIVESAIIPLVVKRARPIHISAMETTVNQMYIQKNNPRKADKADRDFHLLLLRACGNELLASLTNVVSLLFDNTEYRSRYWSPDIIARLAQQHQEIINAIKAGNTEIAVERHKNHLHYKEKIQNSRA